MAGAARPKLALHGRPIAGRTPPPIAWPLAVAASHRAPDPLWLSSAHAPPSLPIPPPRGLPMKRRVLAGMFGLALAGCRSSGPGLAQPDGSIPVPGRGPIRGQSPPDALTPIPRVRDAINHGQPPPHA